MKHWLHIYICLECGVGVVHAHVTCRPGWLPPDSPPFHLRYRFAEIYYRRGESTHKGRSSPARVETTVLFLPDVWNVCPAKLEWDGLHLNYKRQLDKKLSSAAGCPQQPSDQEGEEEEDKALTPTFFFSTVHSLLAAHPSHLIPTPSLHHPAPTTQGPGTRSLCVGNSDFLSMTTHTPLFHAAYMAPPHTCCFSCHSFMLACLGYFSFLGIFYENMRLNYPCIIIFKLKIDIFSCLKHWAMSTVLWWGGGAAREAGSGGRWRSLTQGSWRAWVCDLWWIFSSFSSIHQLFLQNLLAVSVLPSPLSSCFSFSFISHMNLTTKLFIFLRGARLPLMHFICHH